MQFGPSSRSIYGESAYIRLLLIPEFKYPRTFVDLVIFLKVYFQAPIIEPLSRRSHISFPNFRNVTCHHFSVNHWKGYNTFMWESIRKKERKLVKWTCTDLTILSCGITIWRISNSQNQTNSRPYRISILIQSWFNKTTIRNCIASDCVSIFMWLCVASLWTHIHNTC